MDTTLSHHCLPVVAVAVSFPQCHVPLKLSCVYRTGIFQDGRGERRRRWVGIGHVMVKER